VALVRDGLRVRFRAGFFYSKIISEFLYFKNNDHRKSKENDFDNSINGINQ
jgi:hypothetical protein